MAPRSSVLTAFLTLAAVVAAGLAVAAPAQARDFFVVVDAGTRLTAADRLISSTQSFTLTVQTDGNVVERQGAKAVWTTRTAGNPGAVLDVQTDGNLVLRSSSGRALWSSGTPGHRAPQLQLGDAGELQLASSGAPPYWSNGVGDTSPTVLASGQSVRSDRDERVDSPGGRFRVSPTTAGLTADEFVSGNGTSTWYRGLPDGGSTGPTVLTMQTDGNLVLRGTNGVAYWASGSRGAGNRFVVQDDGNFVVRRPNGSAAWSSGTTRVLLGSGETAGSGARFLDRRYQSGPQGSTVVQSDGNVVRRGAGNAVEWSTRTAGNPGARLTLQTDGNLVVRRPDGRAVWQSGTSRCGRSAAFDTISGSLTTAARGTVWSVSGGSRGVC